jgi:phage-related protein
MKPVAWVGDSKERLRAFPPDAMRDAGYQLYRVQTGGSPASWKPMPSIGIGVNEIRVHIAGAFRVVYIAKFPEAIYVLHAFQKKSWRTPGLDIALARERLRTVLAARRRQ